MISSTQPVDSSPKFDIEAVQAIVAVTVNQITMTMVKALMAGQQEQLNFKALAEKHINVNLEEELAESDEKTQLVYKKLFVATNEHIQHNSMPLKMTFGLINQQTGSDQSAGKFLGSFVFPAAKAMIETLKEKQPGSLESPKIWE